jgi:hypothetical protein
VCVCVGCAQCVSVILAAAATIAILGGAIQDTSRVPWLGVGYTYATAAVVFVFAALAVRAANRFKHTEVRRRTFVLRRRTPRPVCAARVCGGVPSRVPFCFTFVCAFAV